MGHLQNKNNVGDLILTSYFFFKYTKNIYIF